MKNVIFGGFDLHDRYREQFQRKLFDLMESAPSDASSTSTITKIKDGYQGIFKIFSRTGNFEARASERHVEDVLKSLFSQLSLHILNWKKDRLLQEGW